MAPETTTAPLPRRARPLRRLAPATIAAGALLLSLAVLVPGARVVADETAESVEVARTGVCPDALAPFDELLGEFLATHEVPGAALAVVKDGRLVLARGYGRLDRDDPAPVEPTSLFRIASISKPITALGVLKLVEKGKLRLDQTIAEVLHPQPHLADGAEPDPRLAKITIAQLLRHTGGWDRDVSFDPMFRSVEIAQTLGEPPPAKPAAVIRYMWGQPLDFDPGARFAYSNFGYCLLGRAIERVTGAPYERWVRDEVLAPLGIHAMRLGSTLERAPGEVRYHAAGAGKGPAVLGGDIGKPVPRPYGAWYLEAMDAHGGWIASAVDLARFAAALDRDDTCPILSKETVRSIRDRPEGLAGHEPDGAPKPAYYGYGFMVRPKGDDGRANRWHAGALSGTSTLLVLRHDRLSWAVLFNSRRGRGGGYLSGLIDPLLHRAADRVESWPEDDLFERFPSR